MDERTRALIALSRALSRGTRDQWRQRLSWALQQASAAEVEECVLQSYLFLGYPTTLQALAVLREMVPLPASVEGTDDPTEWRIRGEYVCATVYGGQYGKLRANIGRLHPDVEQWMLTEGYGKVLARGALDLRTRELCVIALLAGQDAEPQLVSHLRGALNAGASLAEVDEALNVITADLPPDRVRRVRELWLDTRKRADVR